MTSPNKQCTYGVSLDDDPMIYKIIQGITKFQILPFVSGQKLIERAPSYEPVVAFVDIHLSGDESGLEVLPRLREIWTNTPIIVMTSDDSPNLIGESLSLGANDFIRKPLEVHEVKARVQARIFEMNQRSADDYVRIADLTCEKNRRALVGPVGRRFLSDSEWALLSCLLQMRGMVLAKDELKGKVWGDIKVSDNAVDRKISAVRQALREVSKQVRISSKYGQGISLEVSKKEPDPTNAV